MSRIHTRVAAALTVVLLFLPLGAAALACEAQVEAVGKRVVEVQKRIDALPREERRMAQAFLEDAKKVLEQAHQTCLNATDDVDRALAIARGAVARGNVEAADMMVMLQ